MVENIDGFGSDYCSCDLFLVEEVVIDEDSEGDLEFGLRDMFE